MDDADLVSCFLPDAIARTAALPNPVGKHPPVPALDSPRLRLTNREGIATISNSGSHEDFRAECYGGCSPLIGRKALDPWRACSFGFIGAIQAALRGLTDFKAAGATGGRRRSRVPGTGIGLCRCRVSNSVRQKEFWPLTCWDPTTFQQGWISGHGQSRRRQRDRATLELTKV